MTEDLTKDTGTPPGGEPSATPATAGQIDPDKAAAKYRRQAKAVAREKDDLAAQLEQANARLAEIEQANKTEEQRAKEAALEATRKAEAAQTALQEERISNAVLRELVGRGYTDPDYAYLVMRNGVGSVDAVEDAVASWLEKKGLPEKADSQSLAIAPSTAPKGAKPASLTKWSESRVRELLHKTPGALPPDIRKEIAEAQAAGRFEYDLTGRGAPSASIKR